MTNPIKQDARPRIPFWLLLVGGVAFGYIASLGSQRGGSVGIISMVAFFAVIAYAQWQVWRPYMGSRMRLLETISERAGAEPFDLSSYMEIYDAIESAVGASLPSRVRRGVRADAAWLEVKGYVSQSGEGVFSVTKAGRDALATYKARHPEEFKETT